MAEFNKPIKNEESASTIAWTQEKFARFKRHYNTAVEGEKPTFVFEGHGFLTTYAKFLIEYLEGKFK